MTLYVYDLDTKRVLARIEGADNAECERKAAEDWSRDETGWTYSPAFGASDGLVEDDAK